MANPFRTPPTPIELDAVSRPHPIQFQPPSPPPSQRVHVPQTHTPRQPPPTVRIDHASALSGFRHQSPHRIMYQNKVYPSALHLLEALKFIENRPDLSERIRSVKDVKDVLPLSTSLHEFVREDWNRGFRALLDEVLYLKFKQHADLRSLLLGTGDAPIVEIGGFTWGDGEIYARENQLGKALERVREGLKRMGYGVEIGNSGGVQDFRRLPGSRTGSNATSFDGFREQEDQILQEGKRRPQSQATYPPALYPAPWSSSPEITVVGDAMPVLVTRSGLSTPQYYYPSNTRPGAPPSWAAPSQSIAPNRSNSGSHHVSFDPTVTMYPGNQRIRSSDPLGSTSSRLGSDPAYYYDSVPLPTPPRTIPQSAFHRPHQTQPSPSARPSGSAAPSSHITPGSFQGTFSRPILKRPLGRPTSGTASEPYDHAISKWATGDDYRPALGLLEIRHLELEISFNPLLQSLSAAPNSTTIVWNLIFPTTHARSPSDPGGETWLQDRLGPALFPSLSQIRIISRAFPWIIDIKSERPRKPLTCRDITDQIYQFLCVLLDPLEMGNVPPVHKRAMSAAYRVNRSQDIPAAMFKSSAGMRRIDWLCRDTIFGGLVEDRQYIAERLSEFTPGTFVLELGKRSGMRGLVSLQKTGVQLVQRQNPIAVGEQPDASTVGDMAPSLPAASPQPDPSPYTEALASA